MSIQAFAEFLDSNPEIASKVAVASNYDEVSQIASAHGFEVSGVELMRHAAKATSELSDKDLEAVAGGSWTGNTSGDIALSAAGGASAAVGIGAAIEGAVFTVSILAK